MGYIALDIALYLDNIKNIIIKLNSEFTYNKTMNSLVKYRVQDNQDSTTSLKVSEVSGKILDSVIHSVFSSQLSNNRLYNISKSKMDNLKTIKFDSNGNPLNGSTTFLRKTTETSSTTPCKTANEIYFFYFAHTQALIIIPQGWFVNKS